MSSEVGPPRPVPTRRQVLRASAVTGATAGVTAVVTGAGLAATRADAAAYSPGHHRGKPLLGAADRHLVTRFSYGLTPALTASVRKGGGAKKWFEKQLVPSGVADDAATTLAGWWPSLKRSPEDLWNRQANDVEGGWEVMASYQRWLLMRRVVTQRPVHELMTELWLNHLNVPVDADGVFTWRASYDAVVRTHALGRYADLLHATITHPAMGIYLDNAVSTKDHPNENLGRELLELHTVGRGAYDEDDVKSSARILTGYLVDKWDTWAADYDPSEHWTGAVRVMGFSHPNRDRDGRAVARDYLDYLAHHPRTAERIARKLAVKFVSDTPPQALVDTLARVYLDNDTALRPVLRALVASKAFAAAAGKKVRDPGEDVVATYRALAVKVHAPQPAHDGGGAADAILWQSESLGAVPCGWPRPDGQPIDNDSWASPARMLASMDLHWVMSGGWWPSAGIVYRSPKAWLPKSTTRFDVLVDHLSQQLLGRRSTSALLRACCEICEVSPATKITAQHDVVKWGFHRLLSTILDSPTHLTR